MVARDRDSHLAISGDAVGLPAVRKANEKERAHLALCAATLLYQPIERLLHIEIVGSERFLKRLSGCPAHQRRTLHSITPASLLLRSSPMSCAGTLTGAPVLNDLPSVKHTRLLGATRWLMVRSMGARTDVRGAQRATERIVRCGDETSACKRLGQLQPITLHVNARMNSPPTLINHHALARLYPCSIVTGCSDQAMLYRMRGWNTLISFILTWPWP